MLGASELPLRQGFACGKTLVRRKSAAPLCGAPVLSGIYTLRTRQKSTSTDREMYALSDFLIMVFVMVSEAAT